MASNRKKRWNPKYWSKYGVPKNAPEGLMEKWLEVPENLRKAEFERRQQEWRETEFKKRKEVWRREEFQKRKLEYNKKEFEKRVEEAKKKENKNLDKYENMSYDNLKEEAKKRGIDNYWRKKKQELIKELNLLK
tara:strand:+ start:1367 stop:1768 length:402 start_codon:yes stop_codon:yes gene_type:complete